MGAEARSVAPTPGAPKRRLKNYLLDGRFQLKYTGMVVCVTVLVATILGYVAYDYSRGQTEALQLQMAMQPDLDKQTVSQINEFARDEDRKVLLGILSGIGIMALALAITGIIVTHKVVGPAYKIKLLLKRVTSGTLKIDGALRKGDELQDVFTVFNEMVTALRSRQADEIARLDEALEKAKKMGVPDDVLRTFREVRDRMQAELD